MLEINSIFIPLKEVLKSEIGRFGEWRGRALRIKLN
jgi:hypothetical protein